MQVKIAIKESETFVARMAALRGLSNMVLMQAGRDVADYLRRYHTRFRQKWQGPRYMAGPRSNLFWQEIVRGWGEPVISGKKVVITNTFPLLRGKVEGQDIYPVRAKMLTIPLLPESKGLSAAEFVAEEGTPLFRVGNALCRRIGKKLEAVYALSAGVHQPPWPGALPPQEDLKQVFADSVRKQIRDIAKQ